MRSNEDIMEMIEMRNEGKNLGEIGRHFGVSRQRVFQLIGSSGNHPGRPIQKCVFPGILKWLTEHRVSVKKMGKNLNGICYSSLHLKLSGKHTFTLPEIKAILAYTGLTFEEAFGNRKEDCHV